MAIVCTVCGYDKTPDGSEFCDACGAEFPKVEVTPYPDPEPTIDPTPTVVPIPDPVPSPVAIHTPVATTTTAKLVAKQLNAPIPEFPITGSAVIGIFDPDMGPVDIDLENFPGGETVSRNHAQIFHEAGEWKIQDLGSTNGVFIKPFGQTRFNARINTPVPLSPGDEIAIAKVLFLFQSP